VGERLVDVGALVGDGGATPLAVVVQEDPVLVRFSPTERERRVLLALDPGLERTVSEGQQPVFITLSDGTTLERPGSLTCVGNALDTTTRSLLYKATVPNLAPALKPGESVTAVLELPPSEGVVVPAVAVASVQDVDYVYVVDEDGVVHQREVEVGRMAGTDRVIAEGRGRGLVRVAPRALEDGGARGGRGRRPGLPGGRLGGGPGGCWAGGAARRCGCRGRGDLLRWRRGAVAVSCILRSGSAVAA